LLAPDPEEYSGMSVEAYLIDTLKLYIQRPTQIEVSRDTETRCPKTWDMPWHLIFYMQKLYNNIG